MTATQIGVFFDGTGMNRDMDIPLGRETNVAKLYGLYATTPYEYQGEMVNHIQKKYIRGVGTYAGNRLIGGLTGNGAYHRLTDAYYAVKQHFDRHKSSDEKYVDLFGFSRGASMARHFANMLVQLGIPVDDDNTSRHSFSIRFLGIFDSVGSFGFPGNNIDLDFDFAIPDSVTYCMHLTAEHECRSLFDLQSIKPSAESGTPAPHVELSCPGSHSDVGGGYAYQPPVKEGQYKKRIIKGKVCDIPEDDQRYDSEEYYDWETYDLLLEGLDETYYLSKKEEKSNELSRVPLSIMYTAMTGQGLNLIDMKQHPRYRSSMAISDELQCFVEGCSSGMTFEDAIHTKYIHDSRFLTDKLEDKYIRNTARTVFYSEHKSLDWERIRDEMIATHENYDEDDVGGE